MNTLANPFIFDKKDDSSGYLLWQVANVWQRAIKKVLLPYGITHPQFVLLASTMWLNIHEGEVTQVALSDHTKIDPMTTSTVLRTLEQKGLISRKEHETDTRAKTINLTEQGKNVILEAIVAVEDFDVAFFEKTGRQQLSFNQHLLQLLELKA